MSGAKRPEDQGSELAFRTRTTGHTVFPGTGCVALAMEAAVQMVAAGGSPCRPLELFDLKIRKVIAINDVGGTELLVAITNASSLPADLAAY